MKKRHQAQGDPSRWNRKNNEYRPHLRHQPNQSNNGKWKDISAVPNVIDDIHRRISKRTTRILRHEGYLREDDGAIEWGKMSLVFYPDCPEVKTWMKHTWLLLLEKECNKKRFHYCSNSYGYILYMRAVQGHSGEYKVGLSLQDIVEIPYYWIEYIYHVGSSEETKLIYHCRTMWKSRTIGSNTFITLILPRGNKVGLSLQGHWKSRTIGSNTFFTLVLPRGNKVDLSLQDTGNPVLLDRIHLSRWFFQEETKLIYHCKDTGNPVLLDRIHFITLVLPRGNKVDLSLQNNVEIPYYWIEYIYHVGSSKRQQSWSITTGHSGNPELLDRIHSSRWFFQEETKLIYHCRTLWKSRTTGSNTFITLVLPRGIKVDLSLQDTGNPVLLDRIHLSRWCFQEETKLIYHCRTLWQSRTIGSNTFVTLVLPRGNKVDLSLQDTVEIPYTWIEYIYHAGSSKRNQSWSITAGHCGILVLVDRIHLTRWFFQQSWSITAGHCENPVLLDRTHLSRWFFHENTKLVYHCRTLWKSRTIESNTFITLVLPRGNKVDLSLQDTVEIPYCWIEYIFHAGSSKRKQSWSITAGYFGNPVLLVRIHLSRWFFQEETKLIYHYRTLWKSRTIGSNTFITLVLPRGNKVGLSLQGHWQSRTAGSNTFNTLVLSRGNKVDLSLQDTAEIPYYWIEYIYHVGSSKREQSWSITARTLEIPYYWIEYIFHAGSSKRKQSWSITARHCGNPVLLDRIHLSRWFFPDETKLIYHCKTLGKSRTLGSNRFITLGPPRGNTVEIPYYWIEYTYHVGSSKRKHCGNPVLLDRTHLSRWFFQEKQSWPITAGQCGKPVHLDRLDLSCWFFQEETKLICHCRTMWESRTAGSNTFITLVLPRGNTVDLSLQDNVEIPYYWIEHFYHVGSSHCCNSRHSTRSPNSTAPKATILAT